MFPMEFDTRLLGSLPYPGEEGIRRVTRILETMVTRRLLPYFKTHRGTDSILLARLKDHVHILRLVEESGDVRTVSFLRPRGEDWEVLIHERVFDYLAFVIPSDPESRLGEGTREERKMLAWAELLLRHQLEHVLYPQAREREVILGDARFAMVRKEKDPTYYTMLLEALADEMNGLQGRRYLALMEHAEQQRPLEAQVRRILEEHVGVLADAPGGFLEEIMGVLDPEIQAGILGHCFRHSRSTSHALTRRAAWMHKLLDLLTAVLSGNGSAEDVVEIFKDRWGVANLFHELEIPETQLEGKNAGELLGLLREALMARKAPHRVQPAMPPTSIQPVEKPPAEKSLKDRIDEAKADPLIPAQVLEVIEKNKLNAVGHSGSKYSELIETLLAIPWGKLSPIEVTPAQFEEGLNRSHYGLERPKEILCDFFSNLIWRYRKLGPRSQEWAKWKRTGSAFLLVGPPGVGKTSLAISVAQNLSIPYHKISLGGMKDEADLRGHGFTYEGSKPGSIVQGLIRMGVMNGMFIMDEADKTEKFAIATLLEILDPEQNHLFHDKYTQTTVDIDLSNCHFMLTANTLETVPPPVANRCEIIFLDRYSVEEKIAIAKKHLIKRVRETHQIPQQEIFFDPSQENELLRILVRNYTREAGVRELERLIRTLFLRIQRKEILGKGKSSVCITRERIKEFLDEPQPPRRINPEDRVGEMLALGVNPELGIGSVIPIQATPIPGSQAAGGRRSLSIIHATGNLERIMDESRKVATTGLTQCARELGIEMDKMDEPVHLHFMGASTRKDGPSAGGAIALSLASLLSGKPLRRDVAMTGEIDTRGRITAVGAIDLKLETAFEAGCKTVIIPLENLHGDEGVQRLPQALKEELQILTFHEWMGDHEPFDYQRHVLQVVAVDSLVQAARVALVEQDELEEVVEAFAQKASALASSMNQKGSQGLMAVLVKDPEEMDPRCLESSFLKGCHGCVFLVWPPRSPLAMRKLEPFSQHVEVRQFNPRTETLLGAMEELISGKMEAGTPIRWAALSAPFFFLQKDGIRPEQLQARGEFLGLRLFSNNYTSQRVKIKACKPILNQVYSTVAGLDDEALRAMGFLAQVDGIWSVDLSFIPEKYRLDIQRAETILTRCLDRWLTELEARLRAA